MESKDLYFTLLGLKQPWTVEEVATDVAKQAMVVTVVHPPKTRFCCPKCQRELTVFDHAAERRWRHLDSDHFITFVQAKPPRIDCPDHGKLQADLPWAEPGSRFTIMVEALAIKVLQAGNVKRAAALLRLSWEMPGE